MNLEELKEKLKDDKFKNMYSIGKSMEERLCLTYENNEWIISTCERGNSIIVQKFPTENEACEKFWEHINFIVNLL